MKAALLDVVSGMPRFYPGLALVCALGVAAPARAQLLAALQEGPPLLGMTLDAQTLRDLPISNNPLVVLENITPEAIADRFSAGGLNVASAPRVGGFLNSWTQTQFRLGDVAITDPRAGGAPLLLPALRLFDQMTIGTGAMGVDDNAPALSMMLAPLRPGATWLRAIDGTFSAPALVSKGDALTPPVDRVNQWQDGSAAISGPLTTRLGLAAFGSWRRLSHIAPPSPAATAQVASAFAHLTFAVTARDEVRALGWTQRSTAAPSTDTAVHLQSTWERRAPARAAWRLFGGYTERRRSAPSASSILVDSLTSDPVSEVVDAGAGSTRRWVAGARAALASARLPAFGVDLEGAQMRAASTGIAQVRELVGGAPARVWAIQGGGADDVRLLRTIAAYANEQLVFHRFTLDAGIRLDHTSGAADGAANGIRWTTLLPRAALRWQAGTTPGLTLVAAYRRSAYQLLLNALAIGDPAAPVADVSRWNGTAVGPLVARVGPGTGGDATFAQIDPQLRRPITDELVLAVQARPRKGLHMELARVTKREEPLLELVDTGLASLTYTAFQVPDPNFLQGSPVGAPQVTVYNRPAGAYGVDRYLLTNRAGNAATFWGLQLSIRASTERLTMLFATSLTWARGPAAAVGFLPTQNDQDVVSNTLVDPNAATWLRGQLFQDRSHVGKIAAVYRFPARVRLGAVLRYQDGQPFARLVVVPNLTQGATAVRSYANGGSAFHFTGTVDLRVQKIFTAGRSEVAGILDLYNVPNLRYEAIEDVTSGPLFRTPGSLQPPRTAIAGVRVTF
jgi:hypothetical protein